MTVCPECAQQIRPAIPRLLPITPEERQSTIELLQKMKGLERLLRKKIDDR